MSAIFISGVTSGLGQATAQLFIQNGWKVIGTGRRAERLESLRSELGENFLGLCFDIRDKAAVDAAIASIPEGFSQIAVLMNNAGLFVGTQPVQTASMDDWETMVQTNILGLLYCTRALLPGMLERGKGHVINIGSVTGTRACRTGNVYGASKAFVRHFSDNMRADLLGSPVRVTCIEPGRTRTEFSLVHSGGDVEASERDYLGGEPLLAEDIANTVWWVVNCPQRMNVSKIEVMPTCQADAGTMFAKR
ncbi:MAG: SDR family NAD(P)-dependent oxidoreductase [Mailhella sp.]|nr:SDR family NAD(P)-dependent oxidoreductase [Mailhella sp.]